ncbi:MAG: DUF2891 domain-containing protein [Bacteroidota bacterium]
MSLFKMSGNSGVQKWLFALVILSSCYQRRDQVPQQDLAVERRLLDEEAAEKLVELPLACVEQKYPYRLGQTLGDSTELQAPKELHPIFYGCFDWHSAVHGYWSMVKLLSLFPEIEQEAQIRQVLTRSITTAKVQTELQYFYPKHNRSFERTYGWAWLLKLSAELKKWDDPLGAELAEILKPLTAHIASAFMEFLPKLVYPIRSGEHPNTAFALTLAYDYAASVGDGEFLKLITTRANAFFLQDQNCPLSWEPSGYDFLSPCLEEVDIMRRVLNKASFLDWIGQFSPQLLQKSFILSPGQVSDRSDGKLVHLDGLNFSRAWVLYGLANQYPEEFRHLSSIATAHLEYSYPNLLDDGYEGGHWLGTFAIYALTPP